MVSATHPLRKNISIVDSNSEGFQDSLKVALGDSSKQCVLNLGANSDESLEMRVLDLGIRAKISAILFVSTRPVSSLALADVVGCDVAVVDRELHELKKRLDPAEFGFGLDEVAEAWQFRSSPLAASVIARLAPPMAKRLSKAASETLAVIAYKQPVGKAEVDSIRGVDSLPTLRTLLDLRLIRAVGRSNSPGHPVLYGTTTFFLERFGLKDLSELPTLRELQDLEVEPIAAVALAEQVDVSVVPTESYSEADNIEILAAD